MVAAVMLATAALMERFDMAGIPGILGRPIGPMLGIPMPMGRGRGKGKERGPGDGVGSGSWRMAFGRRLSGMGTPALAHIAAALAFAISSNWSLSDTRQKEEIIKLKVPQTGGAVATDCFTIKPIRCTLPSSVSRGGVLLVLRRVRDPERRCLRRMRTGEWLGSLFHLSRLSKERLRNTGRLPRPLERDLRLRSDDRDLERLLLSPDLDLFLRPVERLLDRLLLSGVLDLLLPRVLGERDRLFRAGERVLDLWVLCRDLERERLRRAERDLLRRAGLRDFERFFFFSGDGESFLFAGDLDLKK